MPSGTPISRHCIVTLRDGSVVIDWGNAIFQDILTGNFMPGKEPEVSHPVVDTELDVLKRAGRVEQYDKMQVYLFALPELPHNVLD